MNDAQYASRANEVKRSLHQPAAVARIIQEASVIRIPAVLMARAVQIVSEALGSEFCGIFELLPSGDALELASGAGLPEGSIGRATIPAGAGSQAAFTLTAEDPVVANDFNTETRFSSPSLFLDQGVVSGLSVVIPGRNRPFGLLWVGSQQKAAFSAEDGQFLKSIAGILSLALQRDQADDTRRRQESEYRRVFESQLIGIAFWSSGGEISEANDEFLKLIGYSRADLEVGKVRWTDLTPSEDLHLDYSGLAEIRQRGRSTPYEKEYIRKDGSRVPIMIGGAAFEGETDRGVCFALDMSRVKRAEIELTRLAQRDGALLANSWDVISVHAPDGTMIYQSPSIQRVLGYDQEELLGQKILDYIHPDDRPSATEWVERIQSTPGTQPPFETRFRHKNGEWRWCECLGTNLLDHPAVNGLLFNSRDVTDRKQAEDDLRRSERRYRTMVTATSMMIWTATPDGQVIPNEDQNDFSGLPKAVSAGWGWLEALHPDDRTRAERDWRSAVASGQPVAQEVRVRRADGVWRRIAVRIVPVRDADGRIEEWVGVGEDVTELRLAGEEVRRSERRYRSLVSALYQIVFVVNARGEVVESTGTGTILGPDEPLAAASWIDRMHPDDRERTLAQWTETLTTGRPIEIGYRVRRYDGEWRQVIGRAIPVRSDEGQAEEWVGVIEDVTDQRRAVEELRRNERRYRMLVIASTQIVWVLTPKGEPVVVHGGEAFFGAPEHPVPVSAWLDRTHPDDRDRVEAAVSHSLRTEEPLRIEYRLRREDGKWRQVISRGLPVRNESGVVEEWIGVVEDVSDERQLEEQLRQSQKMEAVGQLAGGVAHDFNNLLTIINGYSELLLAKLPPVSPMRDKLLEISKAGQRAGTLTRQLLMFSRQQVLEPKVLSLNAVVSEAERMLRRLIGEDVRFATALAPALAPVKVDPGQVEQVLLNLCVNARDAMPTGGNLTIETQNVTLDDRFGSQHPDVAPGDYTMLSVSDTGTGMDEATRAHIFEPFFTTKGPGKGTGLGLAVVFGVVKQNNGHIEVCSEVGQGTTFKLYFPQVNEVEGKSSPGSALMPRGFETVLLAEDDEAVRALARLILTGCGYTVLEARDGREAVRAVERHSGPLDLLISDVVMPHLGGRQLAEKVVALRPGLKVLFLSGYTDDAVVRHGVLEAEFAFLQKPFSPSGLAVKVREVLSGMG